ncbi:MAG: adenylate/guanylate cyclase domain-containing protein [Actinomycetota bacterium]
MERDGAGGQATTVDRAYMFTDVEGSTARWERDPVTTAVEIEKHDRIVRAAIAACEGDIFSTAGDSFGAAFRRPSQAAGAALAIQQALADADWAGAPVRVRIGLHCGEASHRGGDYFGVPLNRAARIADSGHGGQIVVSSAMRHRLDGAGLTPLGTYRLKDLAEPIDLWQLDADGATPGEFAPLRTMDAVASNLPAALNAFVGREHELILTTTAIRSNPITTLTGVGGTGKTRLALQAAAEVAHLYPGGVWFVDFLAAEDFDEVVAQAASALGHVEPNASPLEALTRRVTGDRSLVVLDNCEHVLDAAAKVAIALARSGDCTILATSREPLRVPAEAVRPLAPLDAGDNAAPALQLFIERARLVDPEFHADDERTAIILDICQALDGLPLAIELAAARTRTMSLGEIRERLSERFQLLRRGRRDDGRHAGLRSTIEWSFEQLDDDVKEIARRSSVFSSRFSFPELVAICGDGFDEYDLLDIVEDLVDKSLLVADTTESEASYRHLESIRAYLREELGDDADTWQRAHLAHFSEWIIEVLARTQGPRERDALGVLEQRWPEIRASVHTAMVEHDVASLATLLGPLTLEVFWRPRPEVEVWAGEALELSGTLEASPEHRFAIALCAASASWSTGADKTRQAVVLAHGLIPEIPPNAVGVEIVTAATAAIVSGAGADATQAFIDLADGWMWDAEARTRVDLHLGIVEVYLGNVERSIERLRSIPKPMDQYSPTWRSYRPVLQSMLSEADWTSLLVDLREAFLWAREVANPVMIGNVASRIATTAIDGASGITPSPDALEILATSIETILETGNRALEDSMTGRFALLAGDLLGAAAAAPLLVWSAQVGTQSHRDLNPPLWIAVDERIENLDPGDRDEADRIASSWTRAEAIAYAASILRDAAGERSDAAIG